jgi:tetratricopeptide (TPR) repeat protein
MHQGLLSSTLGHYSEAIRAFNNFKSAGTENDGRADAMIIEVYRLARDLDKALAQSEQALKELPASRQLRMLHADLIAEKGRVDEGIQALENMASGGNQDLEILSAMASIYQRAKKYAEAQKVISQTIQRFPNESHAYFLQGALYEKQDKVGDAETAFRKALELDSDNPATLNYLGYMLADRGLKLEEARVMIQKAVEADPTNGAYLDSLGWVYFKLNRLDLAEEYLKKAIIFLNTDSSIHDHLGDLYFLTKRYDDARNAWTKSLQLSTEQEEIERVKKKLDDLRTKRASNR